MTGVDARHVARVKERANRARLAAAQFVVTYGPVDRLWCRCCAGFVHLPDLTAATVGRLQGEHRCGSRTSPWGSPS